MRFFHDFMTVSWPHLPLERDGAWLHEIPILAQQHDFLMHGILSLGASHLHAKTNLEMKGHVHRHRTLAMRGLNSIAHKHDARDGDTDDHSTGSRLTATLATSYLLTFTASYMGDPFNMFLVLVRACASITTEIVKRGFPSPLLPSDQRSIAATPHLEVMRKRLSNAPSLPRDEVERGLESLSKVEDQCPMLPFQRDMLSTMKVVLANVQEPYEGAEFPIRYTCLPLLTFMQPTAISWISTHLSRQCHPKNSKSSQIATMWPALSCKHTSSLSKH